MRTTEYICWQAIPDGDTQRFFICRREKYYILQIQKKNQIYFVEIKNRGKAGNSFSINTICTHSFQKLNLHLVRVKSCWSLQTFYHSNILEMWKQFGLPYFVTDTTRKLLSPHHMKKKRNNISADIFPRKRIFMIKA